MPASGRDNNNKLLVKLAHKDANMPIVSQSQDVSVSAPRTVSFEDDSNSMPVPLDLSKSGLRRSPRIAELEKRKEQRKEAMEGTQIHTASVGRSAADKDATPPNKSAATSGIIGRFAAATLIVFGLFCSIGQCAPLPRQATTSVLSQATQSYHSANTLYDGTINCLSTLATSAAASNEVFKFKEAMRHPYRTSRIRSQ